MSQPPNDWRDVGLIILSCVNKQQTTTTTLQSIPHLLCFVSGRRTDCVQNCNLGTKLMSQIATLEQEFERNTSSNSKPKRRQKQNCLRNQTDVLVIPAAPNVRGSVLTNNIAVPYYDRPPACPVWNFQNNWIESVMPMLSLPPE